MPMRCRSSYTLTTANASAVPETDGVDVLFNNGDPEMLGATGRKVSMVTPKPALKLLSLPALSVTKARNVYVLSASDATVIDHAPLATRLVPRRVLPLYNFTVSPLVPTPVNVGVLR